MYWPEIFLGPGNTEHAPYTDTHHTPANGWGGEVGGEDGGDEGGVWG
jgi:hypothetical protein